MRRMIRLSLVLSLCLLPVVAFAGEEAEPLFPDTANCGPMVSPAGAVAPAEAPVEGAILLSTCTATADCGPNHADVSCSGDSTCSAYDRACASGEGGRVVCDGTTTHCPKDSGCVNDCFAQYDQCRLSCTVRHPCLSDCYDQLQACRCYC